MAAAQLDAGNELIVLLSLWVLGFSNMLCDCSAERYFMSGPIVWFVAVPLAVSVLRWWGPGFGNIRVVSNNVAAAYFHFFKI